MERLEILTELRNYKLRGAFARHTELVGEYLLNKLKESGEELEAESREEHNCTANSIYDIFTKAKSSWSFLGVGPRKTVIVRVIGTTNLQSKEVRWYQRMIGSRDIETCLRKATDEITEELKRPLKIAAPADANKTTPIEAKKPEVYIRFQFFPSVKG